LTARPLKRSICGEARPAPPMTTRRNFCRCGSVVAAGLALLPWQTVAAAPRRAFRYMPLPKLNFQTFASQLNTTFEVHCEGTVVPLRLVEAKRGRAGTNPAARGVTYEQFSLLFAGPVQPVLEQKIHEFVHSKIGRFEMFIVPVNSGATASIRYECIFNRPAVRHR
jgi:hypothetical protein